jgi:hypothetical protein
MSAYHKKEGTVWSHILFALHNDGAVLMCASMTGREQISYEGDRSSIHYFGKLTSMSKGASSHQHENQISRRIAPAQKKNNKNPRQQHTAVGRRRRRSEVAVHSHPSPGAGWLPCIVMIDDKIWCGCQGGYAILHRRPFAPPRASPSTLMQEPMCPSHFDWS